MIYIELNQIDGGTVMPYIIDIPKVIETEAKRYDNLFLNEPERKHFRKYLTGLIAAERKTVNGITESFIETTDQSALNAWIHLKLWDEDALNQRRLVSLKDDPQLGFQSDGVVAIDDTQCIHEGPNIAGMQNLFDHNTHRYFHGMDVIYSHYVTKLPGHPHYPLHYRWYQRPDDAEERRRNKEPSAHTEDFQAIVQDAIDLGFEGTFTFDNYFSGAPNLNYIAERKRSYAADIRTSRAVMWHGKKKNIEEVAREIPIESRQPIPEGKGYYFTKTFEMPGVNHKVRLVFIWAEQEDSKLVKCLGTNMIKWEIRRIIRTYELRWTGCECYHRDGKQELGMGECQLRTLEAQKRHLLLVIIAYTALLRASQSGRLNEWAKTAVRTIGLACRAVRAELLCKLIDHVISLMNQGADVSSFKKTLLPTQ